MRRLKYEVMDWIDEHAAVRIPLLVVCVLAMAGLALQCPGAKAECVSGDPDGNGIVTIGDAVWLINYIFAGGPEPVACGCPESFFLFDNRIPQAVETFYADSNWEEAYIGGRTFVKGGPVRYVYSIGPDSQPSHFFLVPDTVEFEQPDSMYLADAVWSEWSGVDTQDVWVGQDTTGLVEMLKYGGANSQPKEFSGTIDDARRPISPFWGKGNDKPLRISVGPSYEDWARGLVTYREYLDYRLQWQKVLVDSVIMRFEALGKPDLREIFRKIYSE